MFQYISCCYLSITDLGLLAGYNRFNTSHVVIYQNTGKILPVPLGSFNTSHVVIYRNDGRERRGTRKGFQYISCCYLSHQKTFVRFMYLSFNTSHVVIYLFTTGTENTLYSSFNTSHVVIYLWLQNKTCFFIGVSIHLMLLFIGKSKIKKHGNYAFQYISCCYLSNFLFVISAHKTVSIHLMLLFIVWIW